jgi:heme/copper-type cytochrome/quinol oxidase subunit 1
MIVLRARRAGALADAHPARAPENRFLGPDLYNQVFTMHGTTMMFLFAVPVMEGVGVYLVPLMIGTRNVAFPRLKPSATDCTCSAASSLYGVLCMNAARTRAGSPTRRWRPAVRPASASTSGRR